MYGTAAAEARQPRIYSSTTPRPVNINAHGNAASESTSAEPDSGSATEPYGDCFGFCADGCAVCGSVVGDAAPVVALAPARTPSLSIVASSSWPLAVKPCFV